MAVRRIVPNLPARDPAAAASFWQAVLGLAPVMDHGFIVRPGDAGVRQAAALSLAREGGSGMPLPALSIEVGDLDATLARARAAGADITYGPVAEPWGVQRFFLRDPDGNLVNILSHGSD